MDRILCSFHSDKLSEEIPKVLWYLYRLYRLIESLEYRSYQGTNLSNLVFILINVYTGISSIDKIHVLLCVIIYYSKLIKTAREHHLDKLRIKVERK